MRPLAFTKYWLIQHSAKANGADINSHILNCVLLKSNKQKKKKRKKLTLDAKNQLIADRLPLAIDDGAPITAGTLSRHLLQHQTLVAVDDASGHVVVEHDTLQQTNKPDQHTLCGTGIVSYTKMLSVTRFFRDSDLLVITPGYWPNQVGSRDDAAAILVVCFSCLSALRFSAALHRITNVAPIVRGVIHSKV